MNFSGITCRVTVTSHLVNRLWSALIIWIIYVFGFFVDGPLESVEDCGLFTWLLVMVLS